MGAAFRPAPADPGAVPGWVVGCFGGLFATSGLLMLCLRDPASLQSLHVKLLAAIFFSMFATVFGWVGFGSGPRSFSMTVAIGNVATHGTSSETGGRIAFGAFATLVGVLALAIWWSFAKALFSALRRPTGDPPAPM
jgi:hypothetical protein